MSKNLIWIDPSPLIFNVDTPLSRPLGGTESAVCYLCKNLAKLGHNVSLINYCNEISTISGVKHFPITNNGEIFKYLFEYLKPDYIFIVNTSGPYSQQLKPLLGKNTKIVEFLQHDWNQQAVSTCKIGIPYVDFYMFVSEYQKIMYVENHGIDPEKVIISRNAMSPPCHIQENDFDNILENKEFTMIYTSTPWRGLDLLVELFPTIKKEHPEIKLKVFSSLKVYQQDNTEDKNFQPLYEKCKNTDGIEYIGSISQTELSKELRKSLLYFYPNTFPETSCIAVIEAMSTGNYIVAPKLGALPETTNGMGTLIEPNNNLLVYVDRVNKFLNNWKNRPDIVKTHLKKQMQLYQSEFTWKNRANNFINLLEKN